MMTKTESTGVRVWSEVGLTIPIGDTTAHLRFAFGHERIAKNGTQEEIRKTAALVDEFNESELERRVEKYRRLITRVMQEQDEPEIKSVQARARRKMKR